MKVVRKGKGIDNGAREAGLGGVKISACKKEGWKRGEKEEEPCRVQMEPYFSVTFVVHTRPRVKCRARTGMILWATFGRH